MPKKSALQRMRMVANRGVKASVKFARRNPKKALSYAVKGVNLLKQLVNVEKKFTDQTVGTTVTTTGGIQCLNLVAQGSTDITRNGDSIKMHGLQYKLNVGINSSANQTVYRHMIVLDKDSRQGTPAISDILSTANTISPTNVDGHDRFVILKDERIALNTGGVPSKVYDEYIPLDIHAKYVSAGSTVADTAQNTLWFVNITNEATNGAGVSGHFRVSFYDN